MTTVWRYLKSLPEVAAAQAAGNEIQERGTTNILGWVQWLGCYCPWYEYRARASSKKETVTVRKALFRSSSGGEWTRECSEANAKNDPLFVGWIGQPVTYEVTK